MLLAISLITSHLFYENVYFYEIQVIMLAI
jgi:hypothetical protein